MGTASPPILQIHWVRSLEERRISAPGMKRAVFIASRAMIATLCTSMKQDDSSKLEFMNILKTAMEQKKTYQVSPNTWSNIATLTAQDLESSSKLRGPILESAKFSKRGQNVLNYSLPGQNLIKRLYHQDTL